MTEEEFQERDRFGRELLDALQTPADKLYFLLELEESGLLGPDRRSWPKRLWARMMAWVRRS